MSKVTTGVAKKKALTLADDDVGWVLGLVEEEVFQDLLGSVRVACLGVEGRARVVRHHAVTAAERVLHVTPRVVLGRGLHVPHVTGVAAQLPTLDCRSDVFRVADGTASRVDCVENGAGQ